MFSLETSRQFYQVKEGVLAQSCIFLQRSVLYENNHQIIDVRNRYWVATSLCTKRCFRIGILQKNLSSLKKETGGI